MRVAVINYGMGNLASVHRALSDLGAEAYIAQSPDELDGASRAILPGVGSFAEGMSRLNDAGWSEKIRHLVLDKGTPVLGICLGMQMLASSGAEGGESAGLGLVTARVRRLDELGCIERVPHVGWNSVRYVNEDPLFARIPDGSDFYFVHSFAFDESTVESSSKAICDYGIRFVSAVRQGAAFGTQFHPEKSSKAGRQLLKNFLETAAC
jgi:imidazole glycerol-phosphate synthase subunit HisH